MDKMMTLGLSLMAFDKMSRVVGDASTKSIQSLKGIGETAKAVSEKMAEIGAIGYFGGKQITDAVAKPIAAFADLVSILIRPEGRMLLYIF